MKVLFVVLLGYIWGSLSPSAFIGKIKKIDLKNVGTHNLGASNTMLVFGKMYGVLVMLFDIAKSYVSVKIAQNILPTVSFIGILAGGASVVGHIYPFYLKFKGGKGLASYGGMILALDPKLFLMILLPSLILVFIVDYGVAMPVCAGVLFPVLYVNRGADEVSVILALVFSTLILIKHGPNIVRAKRGMDIKVSEYLKIK